MIPNQWYVVLESDEVPRGRPVGVTRMGEKLVFWRDAPGRVVCQRDWCAHRGAALSAGKLCGDRIQCPFHGFEYDASGRCRSIPANGRQTPVPERFQVSGYPTHEANGLIWIWWGEAVPVDLQPPGFFEDITPDFSYGSAHDPWDAHYSRVIENQLDVVHLPFVHHNTIGRGNRTLVNGPVVRWQDDTRFFVYVFNAVDQGQVPRRPEQIPEPYPDFHLEFRFPNLWQNHIGADVRIVAAFVPVDEAHTLLYLRFYQRFMRVPLLRELLNALAMPMNLLIAHQDRRVVQTQRPKASALRGEENLVQGDHPVVAYRRRRQELMDAAAT